MIRVEVPEGRDVDAYINWASRNANINSAAVQVFGALQPCTISQMESNGMNTPREFTDPMEVHGIGSIVAGRLHLHITVGSRSAGSAHCGHFIAGTAAEIFTAFLYPDDAGAEA